MKRITFVIILLSLLLSACGANVNIKTMGEQTVAGHWVQVEEIKFRSGKFDVVGELRIPAEGEIHPAAILVHGDGHATRDGAVPFGTTMDIFLRNGYAVFSWDKPGSGESTGQLDGEYVLSQRAEILADGIAVLSEHPAIDPDRIGLWGISQAGWVMPLVLELRDDIAFMIVISGGAEDSIDQMAYFVGQRVLSDGGSEEQAALVYRYWPQHAKATSYKEYREAMEILTQIPQLIDYYDLKIAEEENWSPWPREIDAFIDPIQIIEHTTIPVLAIFGERDKNIDPVQGAQAYEVALKKAENPDYQIVVISGVEHVFMHAAEYLENLDGWLQHLSG